MKDLTHFLCCLVLWCFIVSCRVLSYHVLSYHVLSLVFSFVATIVFYLSDAFDPFLCKVGRIMVPPPPPPPSPPSSHFNFSFQLLETSHNIIVLSRLLSSSLVSVVSRLVLSRHVTSCLVASRLVSSFSPCLPFIPFSLVENHVCSILFHPVF